MKFTGEFEFLSNFYPVDIEVHITEEVSIIAPTVEHAYQAAKMDHLQHSYKVIYAKTPGEAKRLGRILPARPDWDRVKVSIMSDLLGKKFAHRDLRDKLLAVEGDIVEENVWHDNFWGSCVCEKCGNKGQNKLGEILMLIREVVRISKPIQDAMDEFLK